MMGEGWDGGHLIRCSRISGSSGNVPERTTGRKEKERKTRRKRGREREEDIEAGREGGKSKCK